MADDGKNSEAGREEQENEREMKYSEDISEGKSDIKLYQWQYEPVKNTARALLFIAHGYGEHSKRYDGLARLLCSELSCVVISHDHVGHGKSDGERVMIKSMDVFVEDVFEHIELVKKSYPKLPVYIFGQSMGGTISILAACRRPDFFSAVVLSAPAIIVDPNIAPGCLLTFVAKIISNIHPSMVVLPPLDPKDITSDEDQAKSYNDDPLTWHGGIKCKMGKVFGDAMEQIQNSLIPTIQWPFLVVHGDCDKITYIGGAELLMKNAPSKDKEMKIYKGLKHDLIHEVQEQRDLVMRDVVEWLRKRFVT